MFPIVALALSRRQWTRAAKTVVAWGLVTGALFAANAAITGEFNYQGGDRKTFYHTTGFPFANPWETFDNSGPVRGREDVMVGDVLVNSHSLAVFGHNLVYFTVGRYAGFVPYFFPGALALGLFLLSKEETGMAMAGGGDDRRAVLMHLVVYPFTYNGGGGPVGNRYFIAFYPLFLLLMPPTAGLGAALAGLTVGALFTASIVLNPFFSSANAGEHAKSRPAAPVADRSDAHQRPARGATSRTHETAARAASPPVLAYFPDDNAYNPEGEWFWVKGKSRAEVVLRARRRRRRAEPLHFQKDLEAHDRRPQRRRAEHDQGDRWWPDPDAGHDVPANFGSCRSRLGAACRTTAIVQPTSYLYVMSVSTTNGYVPFLDLPCEKPGACPSDRSALSRRHDPRRAGVH